MRSGGSGASSAMRRPAGMMSMVSPVRREPLLLVEVRRKPVVDVDPPGRVQRLQPDLEQF
jgi:hypothetical protein